MSSVSSPNPRRWAALAFAVTLVAACGEHGAVDNGAAPGGHGGRPGGGDDQTAHAGAAGGSGVLDLSGLEPGVLGYPPAEGVDAARARALSIVAGLSLDQKLALLSGSYGGVVGFITAVGPLPALSMDDGPGGVARLTGVTAFPDPITLAATWDRDLVESWGAAMGAEERGKGVAVQLAPMMNLSRTPQGGRNFEGFGEDPYLSSELAARDVGGIQSNGIVATAKHFVGNEQETDRMGGNSLIDERTLHEIYYPPFEASVSAGVGAVMCSYNQVNGVDACDNPTTLGDLKQSIGFSGWVMTDWDAAHGPDAAEHGLDMEMPYTSYFTASGLADVPSRVIDDMATRIVTSLVRLGVVDQPPTGTIDATVTSPEHSLLARKAATEGIVLLENRGAALPFGADVKSILVLGAEASATVTTGGGSAAVNGSSVTSPLAGITARAPAGTSVTYEPDLVAASDAANADAVVVVVGVFSSEGVDRDGLAFTDAENALIATAAAANPRTIVVLDVPGAVLLPWIDQVSGLLIGWYPGEENGNALAAVLFGDESPSGKLPVTFPADANILPVPSSASVAYSEGLDVGYRRLDALGVEPLFEFGFGLSYTSFSYDALELASDDSDGSVDVSFSLANTGERAGAEVSQVYLTFPSSAGEPPRVLRGFTRTELDAGESRRVHIALPARAFACWDSVAHARYAPSGNYVVSVGSSSRELPLVASLEVIGLR
jgi:beta-glucosidase